MRPNRNFYKGKPLSWWSKRTGIKATTIRDRLQKGVPHEALFAPVKKESHQTDWVCTDFEAYQSLTQEQLETLREFELICNISKY